MNYLMRYKGRYRLMTAITEDTHEFIREYDGSLSQEDIYIDCNKNIQIFYWGKRILQAYIPSIGTGRNIIKQIYAKYINPDNCTVTNKEIQLGDKVVNKTTYTINNEETFSKELKNLTNKGIIFDIEESDEEVFFKFKADNDEKIFAFLNPKTDGANRSPFSTKNLPKAKYEIPEEDLIKYKNLTSGISIDNGLGLQFRTLNNDFLKTLTTRKYKMEDIRKDMSTKMLRGKEYIHSIGKWDEYIKFLEKNMIRG